MPRARIPAWPDDPRRESGAVARLLAALLPGLLRWARRRLPPRARRRMDTGDLVQEALVGALVHLPDLGERDPERVRAYVQQAIRNRIRDELRRSLLGEVAALADDTAPDPQPGPLDEALAADNERRFRAALASLSAQDQKLVTGRLDLALSYEQLAAALGLASPDAARVAARRALLKVARRLEDG